MVVVVVVMVVAIFSRFFTRFFFLHIPMFLGGMRVSFPLLSGGKLCFCSSIPCDMCL